MFQYPKNIVSTKRLLGALAAIIISSILSGCAGTTPVKNAEPKKDTPAPQAMPESTAQRLDTKLNIQFDWWKLLQSPQLNALIEQGFNANPTVDGARGTLLKLQQNDISREGFFHSDISVSDAENGQGRLLFVQDVPVSDEAKFIGDANYNLHSGLLIVGYAPELLLSSRQGSPTSTQAEQMHLQLDATYRTLAGNLIASAVQEASLRAQMQAARKIVAIEQSLLVITQKHFKAGISTQMELATREQSVEFALQALQRLKKQYEQIRGVMHLLLNIPDEGELPESIDLTSLHLTSELPLELSAALIEQRPDVRAAQLEMQPANNKYQSTAEAALKDVENTLFAIHNDAITLRAAIASEGDNLMALETARKQYASTQTGYESVLICEQSVELASLRLAQARAKQLGNAIVLYHALGGGWWAMDDDVRLEIDSELNHLKQSR